MQIKKIRNADFHNANKLNGQRTHAVYGLFKENEQVGTVRFDGRHWNAFDFNNKRINSYSCYLFRDIQEWLERQSTC